MNKGETLLLDAALEGEGTREAVGLDYRDLPMTLPQAMSCGWTTAC